MKIHALGGGIALAVAVVALLAAPLARGQAPVVEPSPSPGVSAPAPAAPELLPEPVNEAALSPAPAAPVATPAPAPAVRTNSGLVLPPGTVAMPPPLGSRMRSAAMTGALRPAAGAPVSAPSSSNVPAPAVTIAPAPVPAPSEPASEAAGEPPPASAPAPAPEPAAQAGAGTTPAGAAVVSPAPGSRMRSAAVPGAPRPASGVPALSSSGLVPLGGARTGGTAAGSMGSRLKFNNATVDIVLQDYSEQTKRTVLLAPNLPKANITLQSQTDLSKEEYLQAIETVLGMNGIALLREGDKFLRVVPIDKARVEPMSIRPYEEGKVLKETGELVSQMVQLKNIEPAEAQKAIEPLKHAYGQIHAFDRINSILITDSAANVNRILEVLKYVDQAVEAKEEPIIIQIRYAKAEDIKRKLEEIIAEQQKEQQKSTVQPARTSGQPGVVSTPSPILSAVIRPPGVLSSATASQTAAELTAMAERGIITGNVKIVADERTNKMIIITRRENMAFFEKVINVLDVETAPEVMVKVFRLEYATAKDVASMLNELIGASGSSKTDGGKAPALPSRAVGSERSEGVPLRDYSARNPAVAPTPAPSPVPEGSSGVPTKTKIGQLSKDNIKILSDERTNSLIIMASRNDLMTIEEIIKGMDMVLAQVLIESVVLSVQLGGDLKSGMDWVQRAMIAYDTKNPGGSQKPLFSYAGGGGGGTGLKPNDATSMLTPGSLGTGPGLTYYLTHFGLNMDAVLTMVQTDNRAHLLATPVILTHDNTEAVIDASQEKYFYKGQRYVGASSVGGVGVYEPDVERRKVGLHMKVKPHINEKKNVLLEITQQMEELGADQTIGTESWPTVLSREMSAFISVQNRQTIILGGLQRQEAKRSRSGVPFLYKIPILGWLFQYRTSSENTDELVVFITPYVLNTDDEIMAESVRRGGALDTKEIWKQGWSQSKLAEPAKPTRRQLDYEKRIMGRPLSDAERSGTASAASNAVAPKASSVVKAPAVDASVIEYMNSVEDRWSSDLKKADERLKVPAGTK